jgi:FkbM family methyltransferase
VLLTKFAENRLTRPIKRSIVRSIATRRGSREILNQYYNLLNDRSKARFHERYSKIFRDQNGQLASGSWRLHFLNRTICVPLRPELSWLDWDGAVSILGHDIEIKQTYSALLESDQRPVLFLDVGANYGTHSILFLSAGVPVIAFEPNPNCVPYFQAICDMNGYSARWEQVAIGSRAGRIKLVYPEKEAWLGSTAADIICTLENSSEVAGLQVPLKTLDEYLQDIPRERVLVKIDVEGFEREVISGASELLKLCRPRVIFEANNKKTRGELFQLFRSLGYTIHCLPLRMPSTVALSIDEFCACGMTNFIAEAGS